MDAALATDTGKIGSCLLQCRRFFTCEILTPPFSTCARTNLKAMQAVIRLRFLGGVSLLTLVADQLTKHWAIAVLRFNDRTLPFLGNVIHLHYARNAGATGGF